MSVASLNRGNLAALCLMQLEDVAKEVHPDIRLYMSGGTPLFRYYDRGPSNMAFYVHLAGIDNLVMRTFDLDGENDAWLLSSVSSLFWGAVGQLLGTLAPSVQTFMAPHDPVKISMRRIRTRE